MTAVGVAWGLYDSLKQGQAPVPGAPPAPGSGAAPAPAAAGSGLSAVTVPPEVARVVRLAVSAAGADGQVAGDERALILQQAREAGVESIVDEELRTRRPLAEIIAGVTSDAERRDLYTLAVAIVRADETITGAERIYLAQLAHALGLSAPVAAALEQQTATAIDGAGPAPAVS